MMIMMRDYEFRKIHVAGRSSVAITIPKKWAKVLNMRPGGSVIVRFMGDSILVMPTQGSRGIPRSLSLSVDKDDPEYILRRIITLYLNGAEEVKLDLKVNRGLKGELKRLIRSHISGAEFMDEDADHLTIKFILPNTQMPIKRLINRMFRVVSGMLRDDLSAISGEDVDLDDLVSRDDEVDRLYLLIARLVFQGASDQSILRNLELSNVKELISSLSVAKAIERSGDHAWRIAQIYSEARRVCMNGCKESLSHILPLGEEALSIIKDASLSFVNSDPRLAMEVLDRRDRTRAMWMSTMEYIYGSGLGVEAGGRLMMMSESMRRISEYGFDIAEITLDTYGAQGTPHSESHQ